MVQSPVSAKGREKKVSAVMSRSEMIDCSVRVELPAHDYAVLAKIAAQEGVSVDVLVAQTVAKLLQ